MEKITELKEKMRQGRAYSTADYKTTRILAVLPGVTEDEVKEYCQKNYNGKTLSHDVWVNVESLDQVFAGYNKLRKISDIEYEHTICMPYPG